MKIYDEAMKHSSMCNTDTMVRKNNAEPAVVLPT